MVANYFVQDDKGCDGFNHRISALAWAGRKIGFETAWRGIWRVKEWKEKA